MTVSRAFWKIALKNIGTIIMYTVILVMFGTMNMSASNTSVEYEALKPPIVVFNHDENVGMTKSFVDYLEKNAEIKSGYEDDDRLKDALFYDQVVLAIEIPKNFHQDITFGYEPEIKMRSSSGYAAELGKVVVSRYLTTATAYSKLHLSEEELAKRIATTLEKETKVEIKSKVDSAKYSKATRYFSFANYTILACVITIICLIMISFNRLSIRKRNLVSSIELKKMNGVLLKNCCLYALAVWAFYVALSGIVVGLDVMFSLYGLVYAVNALIFCGMATTIAFLISQLVSSQGAVNGLMNVVALGSSFLCGAFVPAEYLPDSVLAFAHVLPSYYYIDTNNRVMNLESFDFASLWPIILNMIILVGFTVAIVIVTNIISKKRQKIA
ncbi:ABC transporter permease [Candidatus Saccharibacteria bacterium]|nr:ABC transporter permease [Candidatus Saccharibacteria bacterium]